MRFRHRGCSRTILPPPRPSLFAGAAAYPKLVSRMRSLDRDRQEAQGGRRVPPRASWRSALGWLRIRPRWQVTQVTPVLLRCLNLDHKEGSSGWLVELYIIKVDRLIKVISSGDHITSPYACVKFELFMEE